MSTTIEIEHSDHGGPPGSKGQQTASSTLWARVDGGPWRRVTETRSEMNAVTYALRAIGVSSRYPDVTEEWL